MIKNLKYLLSALFCLYGTFSFGQNTEKGLKDFYNDYFPVGVAVNLTDIRKDSTLILKEFNSITPENDMKMGPIHPEEDRYNWLASDSIVNFAVAHHIRVRGHNLCWHEQAPKWIFYEKDGKLVSKDVLLSRLKAHIYTVVNRYKGKIYAWDVVNEAISDDSTQFLKKTLWSQICGEDFIFKAFQYAHEADPEAKLFYNDYNTERPDKRAKIYRLLKDMIAAGIPINGIGLQAHWSVFEPSKTDLTTSIATYASLGLKVQITELDVSVYPWVGGNKINTTAESQALTPELAQKQSDQYAMFFQVFRHFKATITGVTFWNVTDRSSWLNNFPVRGRANYPLLFDREGARKSVYSAVAYF